MGDAPVRKVSRAAAWPIDSHHVPGPLLGPWVSPFALIWRDFRLSRFDLGSKAAPVNEIVHFRFIFGSFQLDMRAVRRHAAGQLSNRMNNAAVQRRPGTMGRPHGQRANGPTGSATRWMRGRAAQPS